MQSEWKRVNIASVCDLIVDCVNKTATHVEHVTPYRMIRTPNIKKGRIDLSNCRYVEKEIYNKWTRRAKVLRDDVLLTREAPMGRIGYIDFDDHVFLGQRIMQYRANKALLDSKFLLYTFLSSDLQNQFKMHDGTGTVVSHIRVADCSKFELNLPPLPTQKKIAHILSTLDDKIELNRKMNQTLEEMAQALFKSWFVDFDPVHAKADAKSDEALERAAAELGIAKEILELFPSEFEESELGMIPKGWERLPIGDIATVTIGKTPPRKEQHWFTTNTDDVKWISIKDMGNSGTYITNTSEYLTSEAIDKFNVKVIPASTAILSFKMTVGRVSITTEDMCTNEAIAHFTLDGEHKLSPNYLYFHLKNFNYNLLGSTSSIVTAVNSKIVRTIPTIVPSEEVMQLFNDQVKNIFEQILVTTNEIQTLQQTRDTLLPKLLSGELDVSNIEFE